MKPKYLEDQLQIAVANYLYLQEKRHKNFYFFHVPNGMKSNARIGAKFKRMGMRAGVSDIILLTKDKTVCIELKTEKGRQEETQKKFQENMENLGIDYHIIKTDITYHAIKEVEKILKNIIDK